MNDKLFYQLVHHSIHLLLYSFVIWQMYFAFKWLLKFVSKNFKFESKVITPQTQVIERQVGLSTIEEAQKKKNLSAIDVKVNKNIFIDTPDDVKVKLDEVKKGKVKTQKNKLKKLRGM
tara:strand:+ start:824 stop:1177 length:354 start_codon:yes stop_codon:yes gene_type:complete